MLATYMDHLAATGKSPKTIKTYQSQLRKFFEWMVSSGGSDDPTDITTADASEYRNYLQEQGKKPATVNTALASIEAFCVWMKEEGHIDYNPIEKVRRVEQIPEPPKWLTKSERARLIRTAEKEKNVRNTVIILTLLLSGLRAEELIDLKHDDILISDRKGVIIVRKGKRNKRRVVPIERDLRHWLGKYMVDIHAAGEWLFDSQRGDKLTYIGLYQLCQAIGKKAKVEGLTPHVLRHTYCHDLITRSIDIGTVAKLAGHEKIDTTLIYTQPGEEELQKAVDKLSYT